MPIPSYSVLVGRASDRRLATPKKNHYEIRVEAAGEPYRIAFNVQSQDGSEVLFAVREPFTGAMRAQLAALEDGQHALASKPNGLALDFIRQSLVTQEEMKPIPLTSPGTDNDLNDKLDHYVLRAMKESDARVYAFGSTFLNPGKKDEYFGFIPAQGIHDVHMNQGNAGQFKKDDGTFQDGALLFHFAKDDLWVAMFIAFQNQVWNTDEQGHAIGGVVVVPTKPKIGPDPQVRIVAAVANSVGSPDVETVTILNASPAPVDLTGWALADRNKNKFPLAGKLPSGEAVRFTIREPMQLSNNGGSITLLGKDGKLVDGVSYTKGQSSKEGWSIVF